MKVGVLNYVPTTSSHMSVTWEWLGGFTDGEGYLGLIPYDNSKYRESGGSKGIRCVVNLTQKRRNDDVLMKIKGFLDDEGIKSTFTRNKNLMDQIRIQHRWHVKGFIDNILPFLIVKRDNALTILNYINERWTS